jgi:hypothetical protein
MSRLVGLAYGGHSLATPAPSMYGDARSRAHQDWKEWKSATYRMELPVQLYTEEWASMPPLIRPAKPNVTPSRAYLDGFISYEDMKLLKLGEPDTKALEAHYLRSHRGY